MRKKKILFCTGMIFLLALASCPVKRVIKSHFTTHIKTGSAKEALKTAGQFSFASFDCGVALSSEVISLAPSHTRGLGKIFIFSGNITPGLLIRKNLFSYLLNKPDKNHLVISTVPPFLRMRKLLI